MISSSAAAIAPVWTMREGVATITQWAPEDVLLDICAEEFHVEDQSFIEDDAEERLAAAVLSNSSIRTESVSSRHDSVMEQDLPVFVSESLSNVQQVCRPYAAQATTLLFDVAMPHDSNEELALHNDLYLEVLTALFRPAHQVMEYSPAPDLLDTSDLKLQPTLATGPLRDPVPQMLDFDPYNEVQETTFERAPKHQDRSLVCPICLYTVAELNELEADKVYDMAEQGEVTKRELAFFSSVNGPRKWEVTYNHVLRQITGTTFLPGLEHLTAIETRSASITYDSDIAALQEATREFLSDRHDGECFCLGDKVGDVVLPGENFLLADNDTDLGLSVQCPTAESLLSLIDTMVDDEVFVEDRVDRQESPVLSHGVPTRSYQHKAELCVVEPLRPGALFDAVNSQYVGYTALDHVLGRSCGMSDAVCEQSVTTGGVSDIHEEMETVSTSCLFELTYLDADRQQLVGYTAFNQLLVDMEGDEVLTRIYREDYGLDDEDILIEGVLEINELRQQYHLPEPQTSLPLQNEFESLYFGFGSAQGVTDLVMTDTALPRSVNSLRSYSSRRLSRRRLKLTVTTQLVDIVEASPDEDHAQPSTSSSDASIDFAAHRGFAQALSARRADFLDDEDSDDDMAAPQSVSALSLPEVVPFSSPPVSPIVERIIVIEHFDNAIWHDEVDLYLAMPVTPLDLYSPSADDFPHVDVLESLETELYELVANLFTCLNARRFSEAQELGVDLQWALSAITGVFPRLGLLQRLGVAVEILLELVVASGNN